jgi:hypothetical protein
VYRLNDSITVKVFALKQWAVLRVADGDVHNEFSLLVCFEPTPAPKTRRLYQDENQKHKKHKEKLGNRLWAGTVLAG